jgi:hypothetical protein
MQTVTRRFPKVQRDIELVRKLLLIIEGAPEMNRSREFLHDWSGFVGFGETADKISYHLRLLLDAHLIDGDPAKPSVSGLTMDGHDFVESIKDETVWRAVKTRLADLPGAKLQTYADIADGEISKKIGLI